MVAGEPEKSSLLKAFRRDDDAASHMPPDKPLAKEVVADFENWPKRGAPWPEEKPGVSAFEQKTHWAFQPVKPVRSNPLQRVNEPAKAVYYEQASKQTLLRRIYFDLLGLPMELLARMLA